MDFKQLKSSIKDISDVASSVPEQFREKCFEILLDALLAGEEPPRQENTDPKDPAKKEKHGEKPATVAVPLNAQVRVFLRKNGITEEELNKIVLVEGDEVHFVHTPKSKSNAQGQLEWSLLLALKNAILKNSFEADPEEVRSRCIDVGFYDKGNFATNFKTEKFKRLFKTTLVPQGQAVALTPGGQQALGELVKALADKSK